MRDDFNIWRPIFAGIKDGKKAFCGPHTVQIDLTDRCNNTCIGCWIHSPLVDKKEVFPHGEKELPFDLVKKLITQLSRMGTRGIILSGSGEPFMYPKILEVIKLIKSRGISLNVITNGSFLTEEVSKVLVEKGVDLLTVSIWAGSAKVYTVTHPGKTVKDFECIRDSLKMLASYKHQLDCLSPHIKIYNVISSSNYNDVENMINFAKEVDADSVEFQIVDIIEGKTNSLFLANSQRQEILAQLERVRAREDVVFYKVTRGVPIKKFIEEEFSEFGKIWKSYKPGFVLSDYAEELRCPRGKEGRKQFLAHTDIHNRTEVFTFHYRFNFDDKCKKCVVNQKCFGDNLSDYSVNVDLLNILNVGTFLRRLFSSSSGTIRYDQKVNSIPCYIGWYYARILTNGDVVPCCKAGFHPLGNLYKDSFSKIWNSSLYQEFRLKAKNLPKTDCYFSKINCLKSCDNWGMNLEIHMRFTDSKYIQCVEQDITQELVDKKALLIPAKDFLEGNLNPGEHDFGKDLVIDGGKKEGFARYKFVIGKTNVYELWSCYTSGHSRPVALYVDGKLVKKEGLNCITGGWTPEFLRWYCEAKISLDKGEHTLEIFSSQCIPHIERFALIPEKENITALLNKEDIPAPSLKMYPYVNLGKLPSAILNFSSRLLPARLHDRYLELLGIYDGQYAYKGPFHVQIDLTNNCNNNCIACWCNSPLLGEKRLAGEEKKQYLPLDLVKELLDEISSMGAIEVYYSGSGEPFMHPEIMKILEYTKKKRLTCHVNTNFTLLDKKDIDFLIKIGVDSLTVSTWAATVQTYLRTHPNRTADDFEKMKENLTYLNTNKVSKPYIKLYNVIFNMNYFEVEDMVDFAIETGSDSLEFTLVDTIPKATDVLSLNEKQLEELRKLCAKIKSRVNTDNKVANTNVLIFQFDQFLRRISVSKDAQEARYDRNIIDSMPCYIGWLFARVVPNGEVHSCLKAHRIPTGSLYSNRFSEIWNSSQQKYFRKKTLVYEKKDEFFRLIGNDPNIKEAGCYKSCDDIGRNTWMHSKIRRLTLSQKLLLRGIVGVLKSLNKLNSQTLSYIQYHKDPLIAGIIHGRKAFIGPEQVVIDPTNRCNLKCISCWLYSPLLCKDKPSKEWLRKELSKEVLLRLIDDLGNLGTKRIRFTGGGEPFMHRDLIEVIEFACKRSLLVGITTNFGLVSKKDIKRLVELGVEELCVSIWAATREIYQQIHPNTSHVYFEKLKENLIYLKQIKRKKPRVTFANVIMNTNFREFEEMYEFGLHYGADALYFTMVDIFPGQTDKLLLNEEERKILIEKALEIKKRSQNDKICLEFFDGFLRRISISQEEFKKGEYDKKDIDKIPCCVGWIFSRILADGSVVPCCRGVKKVMGNLNGSSFRDIWYSDKYNEFRVKAKFLSKMDRYFKEIGCIKECDNLMHNEEMFKRIMDLKG